MPGPAASTASAAPLAPEFAASPPDPHTAEPINEIAAAREANTAAAHAAAHNVREELARAKAATRRSLE